MFVSQILLSKTQKLHYIPTQYYFLCCRAFNGWVSWVQSNRFFFIPRKSLFLTFFGQKSSQWVEIVFFFQCCFFPALSKRLSEWGVNFSRKKKTTKKKQNGKEKKHLQNVKNCLFCLFWPFLTFFWGHPKFWASEWLANFS